jgi:hypothetical protein
VQGTGHRVLSVFGDGILFSHFSSTLLLVRGRSATRRSLMASWFSNLHMAFGVELCRTPDTECLSVFGDGILFSHFTMKSGVSERAQAFLTADVCFARYRSASEARPS